MSMHLILTVRFLDGYFHGRADGERTEWPPSPMRLFQGLVAAAARLGRGEPDERAAAAFRWLEALEVPPVIVSPATRRGAPYSVSVPNNAMDIAGRAWGTGSGYDREGGRPTDASDDEGDSTGIAQ